MPKQSIRPPGSVIFFFGICIGLILAFAAVWGDYEGLSYFYTGAGYPSFNGLKCPILMTRSETGTVRVNFDNPGAEEIEPYYEVTVSGQASMRKFEGQLPVPAHASKSIEWTVDARDMDLGFFIFINMDVLPVAGYSTREDNCGIIVLNIAGPTGGQILNLSLSLSLLGIVIGYGLWESDAKKNAWGSDNLSYAMKALGLAVLLAMLTGFLGWWLAGVLFGVLTILLMVIVLRLFVNP